MSSKKKKKDKKRKKTRKIPQNHGFFTLKPDQKSKTCKNGLF